MSPVEQLTSQVNALTELVLASLTATQLDAARLAMSKEAASAFQLAGHDLASRVAEKQRGEDEIGEAIKEAPAALEITP